jgi:hypothetical protein
MEIAVASRTSLRFIRMKDEALSVGLIRDTGLTYTHHVFQELGTIFEDSDVDEVVQVRHEQDIIQRETGEESPCYDIPSSLLSRVSDFETLTSVHEIDQAYSSTPPREDEDDSIFDTSEYDQYWQRLSRRRQWASKMKLAASKVQHKAHGFMRPIKQLAKTICGFVPAAVKAKEGNPLEWVKSLWSDLEVV